MSEGQRPFVVGNVAGGVARHKNSGGDADGIEAAVGERDLVQHFADARRDSVMSRRQADRRAAIGDARAGHADAEAVFVGDFLRRRLRRVLVQIHADDVRALLDEPMRGFLADAGAGADDDDDLPREFLFRPACVSISLPRAASIRCRTPPAAAAQCIGQSPPRRA